MHENASTYRRYGNLPNGGLDKKHGFRIPSGIPSNAYCMTTPAIDPVPQETSTATPPVAAASTRCIEPRLDDATESAHTDPTLGGPENEMPSPFTHPPFDEPARRSTVSGAARPLFGSTFARMTFIVSCYAVAIGVGLVGAWWMNNPAAIQSMAAMSQRGRLPGAVIAKPADTARALQSFGISRDELPYDGAPPAPSASEARPALTIIKPRDVPENSAGSGINTATERTASRNDRAAPVQDEQQEEAAATTGSVAGKPVPESQEKPHARLTSPARHAQKQGIAQKLARDREIHRIKQQADEELKKKTERRRSALAERLARVNQASRPAVAHRVKAMPSIFDRQALRMEVARCSGIAGFIGREICRWRACKGKWGKDGCPAYPKQDNAY